MRKVKLLAFVLAALMVVAAFAGCGTKEIEANVTDLDERVTKLEELLNKVNASVEKGATADQINELLDAITANKAEAAAGDKDLADAIAKITADQAAANAALKADLEKLINEAEKDQEDGDAALQVALNKLADSLKATNDSLAAAVADLQKKITDGDTATLDAVKKLLEEQNGEIADALAKIEETIKENQEAAGATADLNAAINKYVGDLTVLKTTYDLERENYTTEENAKIAAIFSTGIAAVQAATTVDIAKGQYDATLSALAKYSAKDDALYSAAMALKGNVTKNTAAAVTALSDLYETVVAHYGTNTKAYTEYVDPNGAKVNLSTLVTNIKNAQTKVNSMLDDGGEIKTLVSGINGVTYVAIADYKVGNDVKTNNISVINGLKARYDDVKAIVTGAQPLAPFIHDSVMDEVTNYNKLVEYVEKANGLAAAKAAFGSYGVLTAGGTYNPVFAEYLDLIGGTNATKYNWWNQADLYATISARVSAWRSAYTVVDDNNAAGIINAAFSAETSVDDTHTFYKNYLDAETQVGLFVAKYNDYVATIKPQVTTLEGMTKVTTENVKAYAELKKAIDDWKIVLPDGTDSGTDPDLVISADQFSAMLTAMYGDANLLEDGTAKRTAANPFYFTKEAVRGFFNTTVKKAEAVADDINAEIDRLDKADGTALSVLPYKVLEGYVQPYLANHEANHTAGCGDVKNCFNYKMDATATYSEDQVEAADYPTIYMFKKAFVKTDYDLTYLLNLDKLAASEKVVVDRVNSYKAITDKIHSNLTAIEKALTFSNEIKLDKVSLDNEAAVMALKADYTALLAKGYKYDTTLSWNPGYKANGTTLQSGEYTLDRLMETKDYYDVTGLILRVEELRAMATNLVTLFGRVANSDVVDAFTVKDVDAKKATYNKYDVKSGNNTVTKFDYIKSISYGLRTLTVEYVTGVTSVGDDAKTQAEVIELAWEAYAKFLADNQNKKDTAVEVALADNGLADLKLLAIKAKAYNAIEGVGSSSTGYKWDDTAYGDFATEQKIQLSAVEAAPSVDVVADILFGFYQKTGVEYAEISFANDLIFHDNGHRHLTGNNVVCPDCPVVSA